MNRRLRPLSCLLAWAVLVLCSTDAAARTSHKAQHDKKPHEASGAHHRNSAALKRDGRARHVRAERQETTRPSEPSPVAEKPPLSGDLAAVRDAIDLTRKGKLSEATATEKTIADPAARRLVEWFILRHADCRANFDRYAAFIADSPGWPNMPLMRKRAEAALWQERSDPTTTRIHDVLSVAAQALQQPIQLRRGQRHQQRFRGAALQRHVLALGRVAPHQRRHERRHHGARNTLDLGRVP